MKNKIIGLVGIISFFFIINPCLADGEDGFLGKNKISEELYKYNDPDKDSLEGVLAISLEYLIGFLYLLAVIYGIYGGFTILTASSDDEKVKKGRTIIIQSIIGLIIIFLASTIVNLVLEMFTK
ncbi:hypothetical protein CSB07_00655 [Candidatus Gracilibacteria bacterium]|nr:MAG: hypothetical protein CSB07_00655 [Candidatus Gracilibacteria bacterium]